MRQPVLLIAIQRAHILYRGREYQAVLSVITRVETVLIYYTFGWGSIAVVTVMLTSYSTIGTSQIA